jgi:hypothetical protein
MGSQATPGHDGRRPIRAAIRLSLKAGVAVMVAAALAVPAQAQFWGDWGNWGGSRQRQPQRYEQRQQQYSPFGDWFRNPTRPPPPKREAPADNSHAPPTRKADVKDEAKVTTKIVVMGDGMADWLAYGLEDAFSEQPETGIVRKHRANSGLIHYEPRKDTQWAQVAKDVIAAEKPKFIVMMVGVNDRQSIREQAPAARSKARGKAAAPEPAPAADEKRDPEALARQSAAAQNAAIEAKAEAAEAAKEEREQPQEQKPRPKTNGILEFHSDEWEAAYVKRIDATVAALKSAGVPVFWVGLPAQRNSRASSDYAYLNDLYRQRAEKAGIVYVDIWDGFVDESGRYAVQGPDYEGQIRRLRSGDGVYFTKAGARKLAHYVEREIQRSMSSRAVPVALPVDTGVQAPGNRPGGPAVRPMAGPVLPLTVSTGGSNVLLGGDRSPRLPASDPVATRVLTRGEAIPPEAGRADDFAWPRGSSAATTAPVESAATPPAASAAVPQATPAPAKQASRPRKSSPSTAQKTNAEAHNDAPAPAPARKKPRRSTTQSGGQSVPRPPLSIGPSTWFR